MAAAQNQSLAIEEPAVGMVAQIGRHHVKAAAIVDMMQSLMGHRDELTLIIGGAGGLREPFNGARPQHVGFAMTHSVNIFLQLLIGVAGHVFREIIIRTGSSQQVVTAIFSMSSDRKSTRLNSSHANISYAVFCLK